MIARAIRPTVIIFLMRSPIKRPSKNEVISATYSDDGTDDKELSIDVTELGLGRVGLYGKEV